MRKRAHTFATIDADTLESVCGGFWVPRHPDPTSDPPNEMSIPREDRFGGFHGVVGDQERAWEAAQGSFRSAVDEWSRAERSYAAADYMSGVGIGDADRERGRAEWAEIQGNHQAREAQQYWAESIGSGPGYAEPETRQMIDDPPPDMDL